MCTVAYLMLILVYLCMFVRNLFVILLLGMVFFGCIGQTQPVITNQSKSSKNTTWPPADLAKASDISDFKIVANTSDCASYENITFTVSFNSTRAISKTTLRVHGLKSSYNADYFKENKTIAIFSGKNAFFFNFQMPDCSLCAGLSTSSYSVYAILVHYNETIANASTTLNVEN